jgi:microcin C transport system substrate-binding protein
MFGRTLDTARARARLRALLVLALLSNGVCAAPAVALRAIPKYPPGFTHFDYVHPQAPRGGEITLAELGFYDKLNPYSLKGLAAAGLGDLVFETLAVGSQDEPSTNYGLLAEDTALAADGLSVTFRLNAAARFANGDAVTAADVKHSYDTLTGKQANPLYRNYWGDVKGVLVVDARHVRFDFKRPNPELPIILGQLPVFSAKWGGGKPFDKFGLEPPIASGPYAIERMDLGKSITYRKRADYWGAALPVRRGQFNFERVAYRYYRDELIRLEAFKAGEFDFVRENSAKNWARGYKGPKFASGELLKRELPHSNPSGMQGFVMNLRRPLFQDKRVRQALGLAFDFEWMNRQLFYDQYQRSPSYFTNSEMAATGRPDAEEMKLLEPLRGRLDPRVFEDPPLPPVTTPPHSLRENLRQARALLEQAGWTYRDGALRNAQGKPFEFESITYTRVFERVLAPYAKALAKLGIEMRYRVVDVALYQQRMDSFDYDMTTVVFPSSQSPGNELWGRFGSQAADEPGSDNAIGIKDAAVDALVAAVVSARTRAEQVAAARALDRVLRAGYYLVPHFHNTTHRVGYKNRFGLPATRPLYYTSEDWMLKTWWIDPALKTKP